MTKQVNPLNKSNSDKFSKSEEQELVPLPNDVLKSKYAGKGRRLPPNFAERVLELEMDLERECSSIETINSLLYLYSVFFSIIYNYFINLNLSKL